MKEKFTQGDWSGNYQEVDQVIVIRGEDLSEVACVVMMFEESHPSELDTANANLISAAPEMYRELQSDIKWLDPLMINEPCGTTLFRSMALRKEAKELLLAKARGEDV